MLILLTVLFCRPVYGAATDKPDPGRTGSISVTMRDEEHTAVGGGTLTLYTVAEFRQENGRWEYEVDASPKMELYTRKPPTPVEPPETVSSSRTGDLAGNTPELMIAVILTVSVVILLVIRRIIRQSRV